MPVMTVSLTPALEKLVEEKIKSGLYARQPAGKRKATLEV